MKIDIYTDDTSILVKNVANFKSDYKVLRKQIFSLL